MNILFTLCGRAGSKGCKNKNIRPFMEEPLFYYTLSAIDLFKKSNLNNYGNIDVCINSDSKELLDLALKTSLKVNLINRNEKLAQDNTPKVDVIKNSVEECEKSNKIIYDYVIDLDVTAPLRRIIDIENAINEKLKNKEKDIIFSVVESRRNPYFNMVENNNGNYTLIVESDYVTRQQAPTTYDMNASIYVYERPALSDEKLQTLFEGPCGIVKMIDTGILDIDCENDFELMQVVGKYFFENNKDFSDIKDNIKNITI